jgi:hypothetical protein
MATVTLISTVTVDTISSSDHRYKPRVHAQDMECLEMGAPGRNRTCGLLLRRQTLYPLSYGGARVKPVRQWAPTA